MSTILVIWHLKQTGKVKKLIKCVVQELQQIKKVIILKSCLLLFYATTNNHFSILFWCVMESGLYTITGNSQLSGWTKKKLLSTSQSQTYIKIDHCHRLLWVWSTTARNSETEKYAQQIIEMHQKLQCLQLAFVNIIGPTLLHENTQLQVTQSMLVIDSFTIFNWPLATQLSLLQASQKLFVGKTFP